MNKIWMLALANIRKAKGHSISLLVMFLIAGLLLNAGLLVTVNFGGFFDELTKELATSDIYYVIPQSLYNDEVDNFLRSNENILEKQKVEALWTDASVSYDNGDREFTFLFNNADQERTMSKWKFIGEHLPADDMSIYIPYIFQLDGGYSLGDQFEMKIKDLTLSFTIKGFTDDVFFSSTDTGIMGVYMPEETYNKVYSILDDTAYRVNVIFANLAVVNNEVETGIRELIGTDNASIYADTTSTFFSINLSLIRMSRTMMASMVAVMMVVFSAIIVIVCLIVVRFRINNSIEDDMVKIGSLKAIGYTSRQVILSIILQFSLVACIGSLTGIALSYPLMPVVSDVFALQSGLKWEQGFDGVISGVALIIMLLIVVLVSFLTSRRVKKLNPIDALRGESNTGKYRRNHMPLEKTRGRLPVVLALKSVLQNMKQNIMIAIIILAVSFAGVFAVIMFYNSTIDTSTFAEVPGIEKSSAVAVLSPMNDNTQLIENIGNMQGVRKTQFLDQVKLRIDGDEISTYVMEDYDSKETITIYEGRYPNADNEIALAGMLAEMLDKKIGDKVTVGVGDNDETFTITGLSQGANMGGLNASIRYDDIICLNPDFRQQNLQIYLDEGTDSANFVKKIENIYDEQILSAIDMIKEFDEGMGAYTSIVSLVGIAILIITMFVVILVLYFVISSSVVRKKRELGIQKAIGFTTLQLMNQISLSFIPPIVIGTIIGCLLGAFETNTIMSVTMGAMGIMRANFLVVPVWIVLFGIIIVIVSYMTSMLITWRIRKISAYALVTE